MNVYLNLFYQLHLEHNIIFYRLVCTVCRRSELVVQRVVPTQIIVHGHSWHQHLVVGKLVECTQNIPQSQYLAEQSDKAFLLFLVKYVCNFLYGKFLQQLFYQLYVRIVVQSFLVVVAVGIILFEGLHEYQPRSVLIAEYGQALISSLFKIAEAHYVSTVLYRIQNAVGTTVCLQQSVHLQVLVYPQRVQRFCIKARQEHTYYYQDVYLLVLHPERYILIVALESLTIGREVGVWGPHTVIIIDGLFERIATLHVKLAYSFRILVVAQSPLVFLGLICRIGIYRGHLKLWCIRLGQLFLKLVVI